MRDFVSNEEIVQEARRRLDQGSWDYLVGGSESETTLRRNRLAFDRVAFRPRILVDVTKVDFSTTLLGTPSSVPFYLTATALGKLGHREGDFPVAERMAREVLSLPMFPGIAEEQLERVVAATGESFSRGG